MSSHLNGSSVSPSPPIKLISAMVCSLGSAAGSSAFLASSMALASEFQRDGRVWDPIHGGSANSKTPQYQPYVWICTLSLLYGVWRHITQVHNNVSQDNISHGITVYQLLMWCSFYSHHSNRNIWKNAHIITSSQNFMFMVPCILVILSHINTNEMQLFFLLFGVITLNVSNTVCVHHQEPSNPSNHGIT